MGRTQAERKAETRRRLLDAAAQRFAAEGVEGVSVDAVAETAERTSGALYAHFGSKAGLLYALLDDWKNATATVISAELEVTDSLDGRLEAIWRNVADPPTEGAASWVLLEHELWLYAARHPAMADQLADRYREIRSQMLDPAEEWASEAGAEPTIAPDEVPTLVIALLLGLEMQQRVDPDVVPDDLAVRGLRALIAPAMADPTEAQDHTHRPRPRRVAGSPQEKDA
jgi:AcrR family transcriptional regulator